MNTTAIATIAAELAKLTPQEHLIASELAQKLRVGDKTTPAVATPHIGDRRHKHWSDDEMLLLMEFAEDATIMSKTEYKKKRRSFAKSINRSEDAIDRKIWDMKSKVIAQ